MNVCGFCVLMTMHNFPCLLLPSNQAEDTQTLCMLTWIKSRSWHGIEGRGEGHANPVQLPQYKFLCSWVSRLEHSEKSEQLAAIVDGAGWAGELWVMQWSSLSLQSPWLHVPTFNFVASTAPLILPTVVSLYFCIFFSDHRRLDPNPGCCCCLPPGLMGLFALRQLAARLPRAQKLHYSLLAASSKVTGFGVGFSQAW